ncbi:hypothetical protein HXX76_009597 [Chlamydomonas incerta]|uniref:Protein kinase domain-containing protein n=1 Tax=Chlamydomonas incerta TaxID=51695 RepID=A0A835SX59_CHLIN|nr:hypothetical protein HXX76_009597 [Chlamydomonas incerta]|eukprot:KAG2431583.1 hypothetical protein HXX76_009597 [Chlamydomonas incerta]
MLALLVAQQQQAMPGAAGNPPLPRPAGDRIPAADSAGGASTSTVLIGAIIGGVAGAALLLAAAAASVLFLRRKRFQQQQEHGRPPKPAFLSIPGFGMLHHARKKQQEEYDIKPSVLVMSDEPFATYSSETAAGCASPVAAAATPLPADGQQRPSGSQHLLKEVDSRRLANLITLSSPLREGLETTFMVMRESAADVPYSAALSGSIAEGCADEGAAAPADAPPTSAGSTAAAAEPAAAQAAGLARDEATEGAAGTPAAAVSLLPAQAPSEQQPHVEVAVVELLPHKLGKGAFGRVVEGRYRGQRVAVKQALDLHDGLTLPVEAIVASFLQEVQVMGRCTHPNITTLLAACLAPPKLCLVMEIMDTNLEALLYGGPPGQLLPLPTVLHIAIQVAQGLEYLHPTVIHRDLKPSNVLISNLDDEYPVVKLADFGLSKISEMTLQTVNPEAGSPCYLPPECFDVTNHMLTHKMDMYAFGVLLWTMLTGEVPWKNHNMVSVAYNVHTAGRRPPWDGVPDSRCPRKLHKLVEQCWDAQPRRRPAAAEVVKELLVIREQLLLASSGKLWVA